MLKWYLISLGGCSLLQCPMPSVYGMKATIWKWPSVSFFLGKEGGQGGRVKETPQETAIIMSPIRLIAQAHSSRCLEAVPGAGDMEAGLFLPWGAVL